MYKLPTISDSQILISNARVHISDSYIKFLEQLRDERGFYKYDFGFRIYLN